MFNRNKTDDELIEDGIARASVWGEELDDLTARIIASQWHSGQHSLLYSFASTGAIQEGILAEVNTCIQHLSTSPTHKMELEYLFRYFMYWGGRDPQENWHELTW